MKKTVPILIMVYMIGIMYYTLFMNKPSVFRDLFFFTLQFGLSALLSLQLYRNEFFKKIKIIYLFSFIFQILYTVIIYCIYLIEGAKEYFNSNASDKWGLIVGSTLFVILFLIGLFTVKED